MLADFTAVALVAFAVEAFVAVDLAVDAFGVEAFFGVVATVALITMGASVKIFCFADVGVIVQRHCPKSSRAYELPSSTSS